MPIDSVSVDRVLETHCLRVKRFRAAKGFREEFGLVSHFLFTISHDVTASCFSRRTLGVNPQSLDKNNNF